MPRPSSPTRCARAPVSSISADAFDRSPSLSFSRWMRKPSPRGMKKQERPAGACARTKNASDIGAEQNHFSPSSTYSPSPAGVARIVFERRSEPPCFSVIVIPHSAPRPYSVEVSRGSHSSARFGALSRSAGTAACVIDTGQPCPA